jgi:1-acyl-sn-glycerol-3-phosphate acyltransferase
LPFAARGDVTLTRLGIPKLWGEDPERCWRWMRPPAVRIMRVICPSAGYGLERIPLTGGAVVASNHLSGIDPPLVGIYSTRTIYYMAKIELLSIPLFGEALRWTGTFGVRRGEGDRDSLRLARWLVAEGRVVGMFMEGTRQQFGYPGPAHPGAALVAIQEGVPIVPCGLDSFGWRLGNRRSCALVWGEPISLDGLPRNGKGYKEGAAIVEAEIHRLWRQAAEAVAAGLPERLPDGTPRREGVRPEDTRLERTGRIWPSEEWAAGPLGPVFDPAP